MPLKANCSRRLKPSREVPQTQLRAASNRGAAAKDAPGREGGFVPVRVRSTPLAVRCGRKHFLNFPGELLPLGWEKLTIVWNRFFLNHVQNQPLALIRSGGVRRGTELPGQGSTAPALTEEAPVHQAALFQISVPVGGILHCWDWLFGLFGDAGTFLEQTGNFFSVFNFFSLFG